MDFGAVKDIFANGKVNLSASATADAVVASRDGYTEANAANQTYANNFPAGLSNKALQIVIAAGASLIHNDKCRPFFDATMKKQAAAVVIAPDALAAMVPASLELLAAAQQQAIILAVATKVNWFKIGHHTGQGGLVGFVQKTCKVLNIQVTTKEDIEAVWRLGHWFDTRRILNACGVPGLAFRNAAGNLVPIQPLAPAANPIEMGPEISRRIASNPAGTAKLSDCLAAIDAVKVIPAVNLIESVNLVDLKKWRETADAIAANPAAFHTGAKYLTGQDPIAVPVPPDFVFVWLKSVLEATGASATLLEAQCFKAVDVNPGIIKAIKALTEGAAGAKAETIKTLAHYTDGAAPVKVIQTASK